MGVQGGPEKLRRVAGMQARGQCLVNGVLGVGLDEMTDPRGT